MPHEIEASEKVCLLVRMVWGSQTATYCSLDEPLSYNVGFGTEVFASLPKMAVEFPENHAGVKEKSGSITAPGVFPPFDAIKTGYPHAPVKVSIWSLGMDTGFLRKEFTGRLGKGRRSPNGRSGLMEMDLLTPKSRLVNLQVSMPCLYECANIFQGPVCGVDASAHNQAAVVTDIDTVTNSVTLNLLGLDNDIYARGTLSLDALDLLIQSVSGSVVTLYRQPSPDWLGLDCTIKAGCRKRIQDCRYWNAEENFNGLGYSMPKKNPTFET